MVCSAAERSSLTSCHRSDHLSHLGHIGHRLCSALCLVWCLILLAGATSASKPHIRRCPNLPKVNTTRTASNRTWTFAPNGTQTSHNRSDLSTNGTNTDKVVCPDNPLGMADECQSNNDCFNKLSKAFYCCRGLCHNVCVHYTELRPKRIGITNTMGKGQEVKPNKNAVSSRAKGGVKKKAVKKLPVKKPTEPTNSRPKGTPPNKNEGKSRAKGGVEKKAVKKSHEDKTTEHVPSESHHYDHHPHHPHHPHDPHHAHYKAKREISLSG